MPHPEGDANQRACTPRRSWFGRSLIQVSQRFDDRHTVARAPYFLKSTQEWREKLLLETPDLASALMSIEESFFEFETEHSG